MRWLDQKQSLQWYKKSAFTMPARNMPSYVLQSCLNVSTARAVAIQEARALSQAEKVARIHEIVTLCWE